MQSYTFEECSQNLIYVGGIATPLQEVRIFKKWVGMNRSILNHVRVMVDDM